jgi:hypothetical protein
MIAPNKPVPAVAQLHRPQHTAHDDMAAGLASRHVPGIHPLHQGQQQDVILCLIIRLLTI